MQKNELRKIIKIERQNLYKTNDLCALSKKITENILNSDIFKSAHHIALYYPLKYEIDITGLFCDTSKEFYLPRCINNEIEFAKYNSGLKNGAYSISEPVGDRINPEILDVIYTPALCCNGKCFRLGYGKGFYDRFFNKYNLKAKKIIVSPKCFITNDFVEDEFDFKCDEIISD
ncbi:MAG: 5-formyltetrahydrofolate cyclo-ligase [Candidatus Gastranaerophilales bacterium]|nr:5-formyltetrahydrofolate cyclo-ligase [bacterium]MBR2068806.1 5-formyltetrahydrofolate cyclo-ligase [Candidatus Gastranaerophilales bacterium]